MRFQVLREPGNTFAGDHATEAEALAQQTALDAAGIVSVVVPYEPPHTWTFGQSPDDYIGSDHWLRVDRLYVRLKEIGSPAAKKLCSLLWEMESAIVNNRVSEFHAKNLDLINRLAADVSTREDDPYLEGAELYQAVLTTFEPSPT